MKMLGANKRFDLVIIAFLAVTSVTGLSLVLLTLSTLLNRSTVSDISEEIKTFVNGQLGELVAQHAHSTHLKIASSPDIQIPVLLIAYSRPNVSRAIQHVLRYDALWQDRRSKGLVKSNIARWPLIVSQDGAHQATAAVIRRYSMTGNLIHLQHPVLEPPTIPPKDKLNGNHYWVARHYKWALQQVFDVLGYEYIIILEDDMEISPDFFDYFAAFHPLLRSDKSMYCISSWNDNGKHFRVNATDVFYRSDFFPGLGWMMSRELWAELKPKWPRAFWDDWMRLASVRRGRSCIRPEVSRNLNFGEVGASKGQFFKEHIAPNVPNKGYVDYTSIDVNQYRKLQYDKMLLQRVYRLSLPASTAQLQLLQAEPHLLSHPFYYNNPNALFSAAGVAPGSPPSAHPALYRSTPFYCGQHCLRRYVVYYSSRGPGDYSAFAVEAKRWDLMSDIREGTPRGAYLGIVCFKAEFKHPRPRTLFSHQQPGGVENSSGQQPAETASPVGEGGGAQISQAVFGAAAVGRVHGGGASQQLTAVQAQAQQLGTSPGQQQSTTANMQHHTQQLQTAAGAQHTMVNSWSLQQAGHTKADQDSGATGYLSRSLQQQQTAGGAVTAQQQDKAPDHVQPVVVDGILETHFEVCLAPHLSPNLERLMNQP